METKNAITRGGRFVKRLRPSEIPRVLFANAFRNEIRLLLSSRDVNCQNQAELIQLLVRAFAGDVLVLVISIE
jgi:hypothetical protein